MPWIVAWLTLRSYRDNGKEHGNDHREYRGIVVVIDVCFASAKSSWVREGPPVGVCRYGAETGDLGPKPWISYK